MGRGGERLGCYVRYIPRRKYIDCKLFVPKIGLNISPETLQTWYFRSLIFRQANKVAFMVHRERPGISEGVTESTMVDGERGWRLQCYRGIILSREE